MASRSLGSLTLDLIAKFGGFEAGMDRAARRVDSNFRRIEASSQRLVSSIKRAFVGVAAGLVSIQGIRNVVRLADQYNALSNRLRVVTDSSEDLSRAQQTVFDIAQRSRTSLEATTELYSRLARSTEQLGLSQQEVARLTETISKAVTASGASAAEATNGIIQLSQGLASGALRGDELRSVMEGLPTVARLLAAGLDVPIGKLREMGAAGELSTQRIVRAFQSQTKSAEEEFSKTVTTVSQALTKLENAFLRAAGSGDLSPLAESIEEIADTITDPAFQQGFANFVSGIVKLLSLPLEGLAELGNLGEGLGRQLARVTGQLSELDEIEAKLEAVDRAINNSFLGKPLAFAFTSDDSLQKIKADLEAQRDEILKIFGELSDASSEIEITIPGADDLVDTKELEKAQSAINKLIDDLTQQNATFDQNASSVLRYRLEFGDLSEALAAFGPRADEVKAKLLGLSSALDTRRARAELEKLVSGLQQQDATFGASASEILRYRLTIGDLADDLQRAGPAFASVAEEAIRLQESLTIREATEQAKEAIQSQIDSLREQAATLNLSAEAAFEYSLAHGELARNLELTGDAAAGLEADLRAAQEVMQAAIAQQEATAFEESVFEATRTESERYTAELGRLKEALEGNAEFQDTYNRAVSDAVIEYIDAEKYTEAYALRVAELNRLLAEGTLNQEAYEAAIANAQEVFEEAGREAAKVFVDEAKRNTQDVLADFLADPFSKGLDGLVQDFERTFRQIAANALAAKIAEKLFSGFDAWLDKLGGLFSGGAGGGGFFASLGKLFGRASGGKVTGPGTGTSDSIPAMLSAGEFVVRAAVVKQPGVLKLLEDLNEEKIRIPFAKGGLAEKSTERISNQFSKLESSSHAETVRDISKRFESREVSRNFYALRSILSMATGGVVRGPGTETSDSVPAFLSAGEYVVKAESVKRPGVLKLLESVNAGILKFAEGGLVTAPSMMPAFANGANMARADSGVQIVQNFTINAPQGSISRPTEMQIAATAARGAQQGLRRNG